MSEAVETKVTTKSDNRRGQEVAINGGQTVAKMDQGQVTETVTDTPGVQAVTKTTAPHSVLTVEKTIEAVEAVVTSNPIVTQTTTTVRDPETNKTIQKGAIGVKFRLELKIRSIKGISGSAPAAC
jgi:hypothetical protein